MHKLVKHPRSPLCLLAGMALTACSPALLQETTPSPTAAPTDASLPTHTSVPTETSSPEPPLAATPTPTPLRPTAPPVSRPLTIGYIQMIDRTTGWAEGFHGTVGRTRILRTMDGGVTWRDVSPGPLGNRGRSAFFLDGLIAWSWSWESGETWRTQDGGESWTPMQPASSQFDFWFSDSQDGWRAGASGWGVSFLQLGFEYLATTQNGGKTWQLTNSPPADSYTYLAFPDPQTAWALRTGATDRDVEGFRYLKVPWWLEVTSDGGQTWQTRTVPMPLDARLGRETGPGIFYLDDVGLCDFVAPVFTSATVWKLALGCENQGWMLTTSNQGRTWVISSLPEGSLIRGVQFLNPSMGWILRWDQLGSSRSRLYRTADGGETWTQLEHTEWAAAQLNFVDAGTGWAVASTCTEVTCSRSEASTALVKTTDGGLTWEVLEPQIVP